MMQTEQSAPATSRKKNEAAAWEWRGKNGPLLIAEIGGNHEGDFDYAKHLTELAIRSGADYVKFQIYTGDTLVSPIESPDRHAHFKRLELRPDQHVALAEMCKAAGVGYAASVWYEEALNWIDGFLDFYKIGSGDLTAYPLIACFAQRGKPIVLSTGLASEEEVLDAVAFIRSINPAYRRKAWLALVQCTAMYPTPDEDVNLRAMNRLGKLSGAEIGYSDHTTGILALQLAAARGARVLEFHFTDSRQGKEFRDHKVSLTPGEVRELIASLEQIERMLGDETKRPLQSEIESGHVQSFRRALYSRVPLAAGDSIDVNEVIALRPNHGIDARQYHDIQGKTVVRDIEAFGRLEFGEDEI